eukprot:m.4827 g.4827  ORF g.4827 m.4827 type:complete len:979 (+) comp11353_c0_seq1:174-3110(+)
MDDRRTTAVQSGSDRRSVGRGRRSDAQRSHRQVGDGSEASFYAFATRTQGNPGDTVGLLPVSSSNDADRLVFDSAWHEVFDESFGLTVTLSESATKSDLLNEYSAQACLIKNVVSCRGKKMIEVTGQPNQLMDFARKLHSRSYFANAEAQSTSEKNHLDETEFGTVRNDVQSFVSSAKAAKTGPGHLHDTVPGVSQNTSSKQSSTKNDSTHSTKRSGEATALLQKNEDQFPKEKISVEGYGQSRSGNVADAHEKISSTGELSSAKPASAKSAMCHDDQSRLGASQKTALDEDHFLLHQSSASHQGSTSVGKPTEPPLKSSGAIANDKRDTVSSGAEAEATAESFADDTGSAQPESYQFQVNAITMQYIQNLRSDDFKKCLDMHNVETIVTEIQDQAGAVSVLVKPRTGDGPSQLAKGFDAIRDMFSEVSQLSFVEEKIDFPSHLNRKMQEAYKSCQKSKSIRVLTEFVCQGSLASLSLIGTEEEVKTAKGKVKSLLRGFNLSLPKSSPMPSTYAEAAAVPGSRAMPSLEAMTPRGFDDSFLMKIKAKAIQHDITKMKVGSIVCGANQVLQMTDGLSKAVSKACGSKIQQECNAYTKRYGDVRHGQAIITNAYNAPFGFVAHAVFPPWPHRENSRAEKEATDLLIQACYSSLEELTLRGNVRSVALPALGAGAGFPKDVAVKAVLAGVDKYFSVTLPSAATIKEVTFVDLSQPTVTEFQRQLQGFQKDKGGGDQCREIEPSAKSGSRQPRTGGGSSKADGAPKSEHPNTGGKSQKNATKGKADAGSAAACALAEEECSICLSAIVGNDDVKILSCGHKFCRGCIDQWFKERPVCPSCGKTFGKITGTQPERGTMKVHKMQSRLPGFPKCGTIVISYYIPSGVQTKKHPNPGTRYDSLSRTAYLPDNAEGQKILSLLRKAFDAKLMFTVGRSHSSGINNQVTWNDIHHKTSIRGGSQNFGYPDAGYLARVKDELKAKGIE